MLEPWNDSSLLPPPVHTFLCAKHIDLDELKHTCNNIIKILSKQSPLHKESAICSRFIYKFDKKFRNDFGFKNLKKVNTSLKKYLTLDVIKDVENFLLAIPSSDDESYLPTRQMLEYVLVRLLTLSKLMVRTCVCSKQAAVFYFDRVKRGESHWMSLMPYALLSRIWSLSMVLIQHCCGWYTKLHKFLDQLQSRGMKFLPDDYELPENLDKWLDLKNINNFGRYEWSKKNSIHIDLNIIENDEGGTFDRILQYVNETNEPTEDNVKDNVHTKISNDIEIVVTPNNIDQGEVISRESFRKLLGTETETPSESRNKITTKLNSSHSIDNVTDKHSLKKFLETEEVFRNENSVQSQTVHLSFMQWQAIKNMLFKLLDSLDSNNRKIKRKFNKIWKEKCLNYKINAL